MNSLQQLPTTSTGPRRLRPQTQRAGLALHGWKNIALELDRGVRTVQRWKQSLGLPVHRIGRGARAPVFAFADELHAWLRRNADQVAFTDNATANDTLQRQSIESRILNRLEKATLGAATRRDPQVLRIAEGGNLRSIIDFLLAMSSRRPSGKCEQCHSPLRTAKGYFRISGAKPNWSIPVVFCPVCDLDMIDCSGNLTSAKLLSQGRERATLSAPIQIDSNNAAAERTWAASSRVERRFTASNLDL
jgi:hypothetical protein